MDLHLRSLSSLAVLLGAILLTGCLKSPDEEESESTPAEVSTPARDLAMHDPGDGRRGGSDERRDDIEPTAYVTNPTSGAKLAVYVSTPTSSGEHAAIVVVPGYTKPGTSILPNGMTSTFTDRGYVIVRFDPDGRGASEGEEDYCGPTQQAGLKEVIKYTRERADVNAARVGVLSYSFGITMASGTVAGGDSGAVWLMDWEGPANRYYTGECEQSNPSAGEGFKGHACNDEAFWSDREASTFIKKITVPYQRMQSGRDHVHGEDDSHAKLMITNAAAGKSSWVRLNDLDPNATSSVIEDATMPMGLNKNREEVLADWADDLFLVVDGKTPAKRTHTVSPDSREGERRPAGDRPARGGPRGGR